MIRWLRILSILLMLGSPARIMAFGNSGETPANLKKRGEYFPGTRRLSRVYVAYPAANERFVKHGPDVTLYNMQGQHNRTLTVYQHGKKHGQFEAWYVSGKTRQTGFFHEDKRHGPWTWFSESGRRSHLVVYEHDKKNGVAKAWDETGLLRAETTWQDDRKNGPQTLYYPNDKIKAKLNWKLDVLHGTAETFYPNGEPKALISYVDGIKNGQQKRWSPEGKLLLSCTWKEGVLNGLYLEMDGNGQEINSGIYRRGERWSGTFRSLGFQPGQMWVDNYQEGKLVDGVLTEEGKPVTGVVMEYYAKDYIRRRMTFVNGVKNGPEEWFHINEQPWKRMTWLNNHLHGSYIEYHENGQLAWLINLVHGRRQGFESRFNLRGDQISQGTYIDDKPYSGIFLVTLGDGQEVLKKFEKGVPVDDTGELINEVILPVSPQAQHATTPESKTDADEPLPGEGDDWLPAPDERND